MDALLQKIVSLIIFISMVACFWGEVAQAQSSVAVDLVQKEAWGLRVGLSNDTEVTIHVYKNDLVRVRQTFSQEKPKSEEAVNKVAVIQPVPTEANFTFWEDANRVGLNTTDSVLQIIIRKKPFGLTFKNKANQVLTSQISTAWKNAEANTRGVNLQAFQDENFMGLGGHGDYSVNRKGINARIWNTHEQPEIGNDYQNPFYISSRGYAFLAINSFESWLRLNHNGDGKVAFESTGGSIDYFFFHGSTPKAILQTYHWLTGYAPLPPRWAFGLWMSRAAGDQEWVRYAATEFRRRKIPIDMIHMEGIPSWTHMVTGDRNLEDLWSFLDQKNIRKGIWQGEVISKRYSESWWNEADAAKHFATDADGKTAMVPHFGNPAVEHSVVDLGDDSAFAWLQSKHEHLFRYGYDNVMVDGGLEEGTIRSDMLFERGRYVGKEYHNLFTGIWAQRVRQVQETQWPNRRAMAYARGGWTGMQRSAVTWGGDQCWTYGSLKNLIRKGISEGAAGISFWSQCSGGFFHCWQEVSPGVWKQPPRTRNFYERSVQWGAWNPIFRIHGEFYEGVGNEPWQFGPESEAIITENIRHRYRHLPFFYSLAYQSHREGIPMMRAMALEYPTDGKTWNLDDQHMLGSQLLVAPITSANNKRSIYLPAGTWYDYYQPAQKYPGGQTIQYTTPIHHVPVFAKAGAVIPSIPVIEFIPDGPPEKDLTLTVFKGPASTFSLYEDDGSTMDYKNGHFATYKIERWKEGKSEWLRVNKPEGSYSGIDRDRTISIRLHGYAGAKIKTCRIDNVRTIDCSFNKGIISATADWNFIRENAGLTFVVEMK